MSRTLINAKTQLRQASITQDLLATSIQAALNDAQALRSSYDLFAASKGQVDGLASLGADGKLLASQLPDLAISQFLGVVASDAELLTLTGQTGDWAIVQTDADHAKTHILVASDASIAENWKAIGSATDVVNSINGQKGDLTLAGVAFTGAAADVSYDNSTSGLSATHVKGAIDQLAADLSSRNAAGTAYDNSTSGLSATSVQGAIDELESGKVSLDKLRLTPQALSGTMDGSNLVFTLPHAFIANALSLQWNGMVLVPTDDYSISGTSVTMIVAPESGDKLTCTGIAV